MKHTAYVTAEIGLTTAIPTYSGGLGVLAGDHVKAAADAGLPLVAVTLFYKLGYGKQSIDAQDQQHLDFPRCEPGDVLESTGVTVTLPLEGENVRIRAWRYSVKGRHGHVVPVYFLDSDVEGNSPVWRPVSNLLYGGDNLNRLRQEAILGIGGYEVLKALGYKDLSAHLNEGHTAFFAAALLRDAGTVKACKQRVHFTTHTPVPAGYDRFEPAEVRRVVGHWLPDEVITMGLQDGHLNMAWLAAALAGSINGVSRINAQVAQTLFPKGTKVEPLTNGVHLHTWVAPEMAALYDHFVPLWRDHPEHLTAVQHVPGGDFDVARRRAKRELLEYANGATQLGFDLDVLTLGFARRAAPYKRATLMFRDLPRLIALGKGKLQILFAGKAHQNDGEGRQLVHELVRLSHELRGELRVGFLENYNMWLGKKLTAGVDVWLNNPVRPLEACGTSGMKAVLNGVPNLSILDGWWAEGCRDGVNGWAVGQDWDNRDDDRDANALYESLEKHVLPLYYEDKDGWRNMQMQAVATAPAFSAQRMVMEYSRKYYQRSK